MGHEGRSNPSGHSAAESRLVLRPSGSTPARRRDSIRRTSVLDVVRPDGHDVPTMVLRGSGRDLRTGPKPEDRVILATAGVRMDVDRTTMTVTGLDVEPQIEALTSLVGRPIGSGFRAAVSGVLTADAPRDVLAAILDDVPIAGILSNYATTLAAPETTKSLAVGRGGLCSGWRDDGVMQSALKLTGRSPIRRGPVAPRLDRPDDPLAWHEFPDLPPLGIRRRRRIDIGRGNTGGYWIDAMFRDSYVGEDRVETVIHEYDLTAEVDGVTLMLTAVTATPRVLPLPECPVAASSPQRLVGASLPELLQRARRELRGITACTHLNDLVASLSGVPLPAA
jgi:Protein of unknown function (DUF2889)